MGPAMTAMFNYDPDEMDREILRNRARGSTWSVAPEKAPSSEPEDGPKHGSHRMMTRCPIECDKCEESRARYNARRRQVWAERRANDPEWTERERARKRVQGPRDAEKARAYREAHPEKFGGWRRKHVEQSKANATRRDRRWTEEECLMLLEPNRSTLELAAALGRSVYAVQSKRAAVRKSRRHS